MTTAPDPADRPVDLAHLARQTMGSRDLEREVLHLFLRQTEKVLPRLATIEGDRVPLAHVLVGSARGIGARRVAAAAERLEAAVRADPSGGKDELAALFDAVEEANGFIRTLIAA
jgi:HPt (histidine-containing phosphotransfer) domain-containing protein